MKFTSLFPAVITAIAAAGFTLTDPRVAPVPASVVTADYGSAAADTAPATLPTMLAAFDPLSLAPRVSDADAR
jgi:hypothetical protein